MQPTRSWTEPAVQGMVDVFLKGYAPSCPLCVEDVRVQERSHAAGGRQLVLECSACAQTREVTLGRSRGPRNWSTEARDAILVSFARDGEAGCPIDGTRLDVRRPPGPTPPAGGVRRRFECPLCRRRMVDVQRTATIDSPLFHNRYEIVRNLGAGGFAMVDLVRERRTGRRFAAKTILKDHLKQPDVGQRLKLEAGLYKAIDHPHVVSLVETFWDEDRREYVLVMEYLDGGCLTDAINDAGVADVDLVEYVAGVAEGLVALHDNGVVHRDLKPDNVLLDRRRRVAKIGDLGLAALIGYDVASVADEGRVGTRSYAAPEQRGGPGEVGPRADLWALALIIWEVATRESPHPEAPDLGRFPPFFRELLGRALQPHPARRITSARELVSGLRRLHRW